jgi:rhomboid protease GluP
MTNKKTRAILCPNCRKLISADEPRCPYCGMVRPTSWWHNNFVTRLFRDGDRLIKAIIIVNTGMFAISLMFNQRLPSLSFNPLTVFAPDNQSLLILGATGTIPIDRFHRWWTLISANYLHGGIVHILFNMLAFYQLAPLVNREYGAYRMIVIYTVGGITGFLVSYMAGVAFTIGASAAVCGLMGASLYYGKARGGVYGRIIYKQIVGWAVGLFLFGFIVPGINNWAHGGGICAGAALGFLLGFQERRMENNFHKILAGGCVALTVIALGWGVVSAGYYRMAGLG